jgi:hypothetical protein
MLVALRANVEYELYVCGSRTAGEILRRAAFGGDLYKIAGAPPLLPRGPFLLRRQKKWTKEKAARRRRLPAALLARLGARLNSPAA